MSRIIYLYIKTHNQTGLKYLGKTTKPNQHKYKGSGKFWRRHIKKYGYDVTTEIIFETTDVEEFEIVAEFFSNMFDVVNSDKWANLCIENGKGAGMSGNKNGMYGRTHTETVKQKLSLQATKNFKGKSYEEMYGEEKAQQLKLIRSKTFKQKNNKAENNSRYDKTHYSFYNVNTKELFIGTRYNFYTNYNLPKSGVHNLIKEKIFVYNNWMLKKN